MDEQTSRMSSLYANAYMAPSIELAAVENQQRADSIGSSLMSKSQRADFIERATPAVDSLWSTEQQQCEQQARAILDEIPEENLYRQRNLSGWRMDIPDLPNTNDRDPSYQGLDFGDFDPLPPKPPPTSILKPVSSSMRPIKMAYTYEQRKAMKAAVVDKHRPGYVPGQGQHRSSREPVQQSPREPVQSSRQPVQQTSRHPVQPPPQSDSRGDNNPISTIDPSWATIRGPSQQLQDIITARATAAAYTGSQGRAEDAIFDARAQDAMAVAARADSRQAAGRFSDSRPRHVNNPVPNPPADKFLADNRTVIPRGAHPRDRSQLPQGWTPNVQFFVDMAEENRKSEQAEEVERVRQITERHRGVDLSKRPGRYWGYNTRGETELFAQSSYGYTPEYGAHRQPGDDPKMRNADRNTAYVESWALKGRAVTNNRDSLSRDGPAPGFLYGGHVRQDDRGSEYNNCTTLNPENLSFGGLSMRESDTTSSISAPPVEVRKRKAQTPPRG